MRQSRHCWLYLNLWLKEGINLLQSEMICYLKDLLEAAKTEQTRLVCSLTGSFFL